MLGPSWVELFRRIPAGLQDTLVLLTSTGAEIMIQKILIMESDYFIVRGRMSGTQDSGLVIILPYDQISNLSFNKRMLEPEVFQIFGGNGFTPTPLAATAAAATPSTEPADKPLEAQALAEAAAQPADSTQDQSPPEPEKEPEKPISAKPSPPSKSTLLARLRARLAGSSK